MNYLSLLAVYSLFHIVPQQDLINSAVRDISSINKKPFGVFATLTRGSQSKVHGCIGNWSSTFKKLPTDKLVTLMQQLVLDARYKDQRRLQFPTDINQDVSTNLEITLMLLPLYPVNNYTGMIQEKKLFSNQEYGLIFQSENGQKATYLPHVFSNESWENISTSLMNKAGLSSKKQGKYYAYKTLAIKVDVYNLLFSDIGIYFLEREIAMFYDKYFDDFIPYEFNSKRKKVIVDKTQSVRNAGSLLSVLHLSVKFKDILSWVDKPVLQNLHYYFKQWYLYQQDFTQSSIFLLQAYNFLFKQGIKFFKKHISLIEEGLYQKLLTLEPQFALGEAVSTLAPLVNTNTPLDHVDKLLKACTLMRYRLQNFKKPKLDLIFELNWQCQSVHKMIHLAISRFPEHISFFHSFVLELTEMILSILENTSPDTLETNYLVVVYECLCHLESALGKQVPVTLKQQKFLFYTTLLQTRRGYMGLFYFKNKPVARLDLTGHSLLINL